MMYQTPHITLIKEEQILAAGEVLERAFRDDPLSVYTLPDPEIRQRVFAWYFTQFVREEALKGSVYTTAGLSTGVAVWLPPLSMTGLSERGIPDEISQRFGREAYHRFVSAFAYFEQIHHQILTGPHWYLELLGVAPDCQGQGIGRALLAPVLQKAAGLPCYLETFTARNVPFYEHCGFRVIEAGIEPQSQLSFWAMMRE